MIATDVALRMIARFERRIKLDDVDREAVLALPFTMREIDAGRYIVREGQPLKVCTVLVEGFAFRQKITAEGGRQIVSVHIPGDFFDLEGALLKVADHNVQALTRAKIASVPEARVIEIIENFPRLARAMWIDTLIDASIFREWVMNVGRRDARQRIGHLLCETALRMELAGLCKKTASFHFPLTQEQLADATGLTPVHVNRSMKAMETEGLIIREKKQLRIPDWHRLCDSSGFNALYLHLDQGG